MKSYSLLLLASFISLSSSEKVCSNGFRLYGGKCLGLARQMKTWYDAEEMCRLTDGAFLVQPKTFEEYNNVIAFLNGTNVRNIWMGLRCPSTNKATCQWDDTTMLTGFEEFDAGYPNGADQCTQFNVIDNEAKYYSRPCDSIWPFVCELPPTDQDCNINCGIKYNNYCYNYRDTPMTFNNAEAYCRQNSAHLVSINSYPEYRFVAQNFPNAGNYIIGGMMDRNERITWLDNSTEIYTMGNRADGGPCVQMGVDSTRSGTFYYGRSCEIDTPFMCKRPASC